MTPTLRTALSAAALLLGVAACVSSVPPSDDIAAGTWGGENAGLIVDDSIAHAHIGCTYGNFKLPAALDRDGRFELTGSYVLRAYPVAVGPSLPARMNGTIERTTLTFTVTVNDTVQGGTVVLGPATVTLGRDPKLGPCPICAVAPAMW